MSFGLFSIGKVICFNWRYLFPSSRKVGYIGWVGHGNLGDEAMYIAFQRLFSGFQLLPFKHSRKVAALEKIWGRRLFAATFLGGGTLINHRDPLQSLRIAQRIYQPNFVFGSGVANPIFWTGRAGWKDCLKEWVECLEQCHFVGVRGPISKELLEWNGFTNAEIIGDPAVAFGEAEIVPKRGHKLLGLNIGTAHGEMWGNEAQVLDFTIRLVRVLLDRGYRIVFVPVWKPDRICIQEVMKRLESSGHVSIFEDYHSIEKTMALFKTCDLFIGQKLHSVVLALCTYTPSIMLEYQPKCLDFMRSMELERFSIRTDRLSLDWVMDRVVELSEKTGAYQREIYQKVRIFQELQKERASTIAQMIARGV